MRFLDHESLEEFCSTVNIFKDDFLMASSNMNVSHYEQDRNLKMLMVLPEVLEDFEPDDDTRHELMDDIFEEMSDDCQKLIEDVNGGTIDVDPVDIADLREYIYNGCFPSEVEEIAKRKIENL